MGVPREQEVKQDPRVIRAEGTPKVRQPHTLIVQTLELK